MRFTFSSVVVALLGSGLLVKAFEDFDSVYERDLEVDDVAQYTRDLELDDGAYYARSLAVEEFLSDLTTRELLEVLETSLETLEHRETGRRPGARPPGPNDVKVPKHSYTQQQLDANEKKLAELRRKGQTGMSQEMFKMAQISQAQRKVAKKGSRP
ncbi:hypothetical protein EST38_g10500 [Candolleomyces aberdarensis]|uniref:Uncharacterized protein n=1 Tax=Candolleomyces aberdarensis TaxID=2316362 RepID=A0A4Q2DA45_9AGAR|nr:hypothetical protein EST38_g10500 [Candolleomyces aberdarensis]